MLFFTSPSGDKEEKRREHLISLFGSSVLDISLEDVEKMNSEKYLQNLFRKRPNKSLFHMKFNSLLRGFYC